MDFSNYQFRCSSLPNLMTGNKKAGLTEKQEQTLQGFVEKLSSGKAITQKQHETMQSLIAKKDAPAELGKTAKSELLKIYIAEKYGKQNYLTTKAIYKGRIMEDASIALYRKLTQNFLVKNTERKTNNYLTGELDLMVKTKQETYIVDIKTSWDIMTFASVTEQQAMSDYYWQLAGYMILNNIPEAELAYCLVSLPDYMISDEVQKIAYAERLIGEIDAESHQRIMDIEQQLTQYYTYDDMPIQDRIKRYKFSLSNKAKEMIYQQLDMCRDYLNNMSL